MLRAADKRVHVGEQLPKYLAHDDLFPPDDRGNLVISTVSLWSLGPGIKTGVATGVAWPGANVALYVPFRVAYPVTVYKMCIGTGVTAGGNFDLGIYDEAGTKLVSTGATARSAQVDHVVDVTDTTLRPGLYYLAQACDGTNNFAMYNLAARYCQMLGMRKQSTAYTLPATATFATVDTTGVPLIAAYLRSE